MDLLTASYEAPVLRLMPHGRMDTTTAPDIEKAAEGFLAQYPDAALVLDVEDLEYISSAGLRVVLRLKKAKRDFRVINASVEVYDVFEMTGFSEMMTVEKACRRFSVEGCPIIGHGAKGTVYRYDGDTIVKVYHNPDSLPDIQRERTLARRAFVLGIPTAISYDIVRVGESYGSVFELLDAKSYSQMIAEQPEKIEAFVRDYAELLRQIHQTEVKPDEMPDVKKDLAAKWLRVCEKHLPAEDFAKLSALIAQVPDVSTMLHCDYHTNNIMYQNGETLLIDMDTLSHGHPIFELANVYVTYVGFLALDPEDVEHFLGMSRELSRRVWELFLPIYAGSEDKALLQALEEKVELLGNVRMLYHSTRHSADAESEARNIALCAANIHTLLSTVKTLDF